jgi:hypothetical protein
MAHQSASISAPVAEPLEVSDTEVEIDDCEIHRYPPLPALLTPAPVYARATPVSGPVTPAPDSRPVIRPPVASPITAVTSSARRATPSQPTTLATAHLGIEESEYDKPTYLRRAMAGEGLRLPGDGKA